MPDGQPPDRQGPPLRRQRVDGHADVALSARGRGTRLDRLAQSGAAKAMLPRVHGDWPEVVFLNTAGGLTGGDRLHYTCDLGAGVAAVATTQTAERAYASAGGTARVGVTISAAGGGCVHWLPQETILFEAATLDRRTEVALSGDACALTAETLVLGRLAMGEVLARLALTDRRIVTRDGRPVTIEALHLDDAALAGDSPAGLAGARALCTIVLAAPGAEQALGAVRAVLPGCGGVTAAASGWNGRCIVRLMAADPVPLRRAAGRAIETLGRRRLPRVWQT